MGQVILLILESKNISYAEEKKLIKIYVNGIESQQDDEFLKEIIYNQIEHNEFLKQFEISRAPSVIDEDATRRYFETHLALNTLFHEIDNIDLVNLRNHYNNLLELIGDYDVTLKEGLINVAEGVLEQPLTESILKERFGADAYEYLNAMKQAKKSLTSVNYEKVKYLISSTLLGVVCARLYSDKEKEDSEKYKALPLAIYGQGIFSPEYRGRTPKEGVKYSSTAGILKGINPVPFFDDNVRYAQPNQQSFDFKPTENSQYILNQTILAGQK